MFAVTGDGSVRAEEPNDAVTEAIMRYWTGKGLAVVWMTPLAFRLVHHNSMNKHFLPYIRPSRDTK